MSRVRSHAKTCQDWGTIRENLAAQLEVPIWHLKTLSAKTNSTKPNTTFRTTCSCLHDRKRALRSVRIVGPHRRGQTTGTPSHVQSSFAEHRKRREGDLHVARRESSARCRPRHVLRCSDEIAGSGTQTQPQSLPRGFRVSADR